MPWSAPLILTLELDRQTFHRLDGLRREHFPPALNRIPAHVTLFHALPGDQESTIREVLEARASVTAPFRVAFPSVRFLGRGTAVEIDAPELRDLRARLAASWQTWLSTQDRQPYHPHVTVQNKVAPETARSLYDRLSREWEAFSGIGEGLLLWRYLQGPWESLRAFRFGDTGER